MQTHHGSAASAPGFCLLLVWTSVCICDRQSAQSHHRPRQARLARGCVTGRKDWKFIHALLTSTPSWKDFLVAGGGDADRRRSRTGDLSASRAGRRAELHHTRRPAAGLDFQPTLLPQLASWALLALRLLFLVFCVNIVVPKAEGGSSRPGRTAWDKERVSASGTDSKPPLRPSVSTDVSQRSTQRLRSSHGVTDGRHGLWRLESVLPTPRWGPSVPCDSADTPQTVCPSWAALPQLASCHSWGRTKGPD